MKKDAFCPKLSFYEKNYHVPGNFLYLPKEKLKKMAIFLPLEAKMAQGSISRDEFVSIKDAPHRKLSFNEKDASMAMKKI